MDMKQLIRKQRVLLRHATTIALALLQGYGLYYLDRTDTGGFGLIFVLLLPLPAYLSRGPRATRLIAGMFLWGTALLAMDWGWFLTRNPYVTYTSAQNLFFPLAVIGFVALLPLLLSWIDDGIAYPQWPRSFDWYARFFFLACICLVTTFLFYISANLGAELLAKVGFGLPLRIINSSWFTFASNTTVAASTAYWTNRQDRLMSTLSRYILPIFSALLPMMMLISLAFYASILFSGIEKLWNRGIDSGLVLAMYSATGLLIFAAWRGGVEQSSAMHEPFAKPLNRFIKSAVVPLPLYGVIVIYAVGLRVRQYNWTVDRALSMAIASMLTLWTLSWSVALVKNWGRWPFNYGRINRIAFPLIGCLLILLVSPLADVRRLVLGIQTNRLQTLGRTDPVRALNEFDWRYVARNLGIYGVRAVEGIVSGDSVLAGKLSTFDDTDLREGPFFENLRKNASTSLEEVMSYHVRRQQEPKDWEVEKRQRVTRLQQQILTMQAYGGNLSQEDRESIAAQIGEYYAHNYLPGSDFEDHFLMLCDLDDDGVDEVLCNIEDSFMVIDRNARYAPFLLWPARWPSSVHHNGKTLRDYAASGQYETVPMRWRLLSIGDGTYMVPVDRQLETTRDKDAL